MSPHEHARGGTETGCSCATCIAKWSRLETLNELEKEHGKKHGAAIIEIRAEGKARDARILELEKKNWRDEGGAAEREKIEARDPGARRLAVGAGATGLFLGEPLWELIRWIVKLISSGGAG